MRKIFFINIRKDYLNNNFMSDFNPTVDLRQNTQKPEPKPFQPTPVRPEPIQSARSQPLPAPPKTSPQPPARNVRASEVGGSPAKGEGGRRLPKELEVEDKQEFQRINRPLRQAPFGLHSGQGQGRRDWKALIIMMIMLLIAGSYYWFIYRSRADAPQAPTVTWQMVKLTDGETFYGQIGDTRADPVVISNVYYDYDQLQKKENGGVASSTESSQTGSIRLVKRGKETHGPDGTLNVIRSQVLYMEPLAANSKVLKAIEEYEKQN